MFTVNLRNACGLLKSSRISLKSNASFSETFLFMRAYATKFSEGELLVCNLFGIILCIYACLHHN